MNQLNEITEAGSIPQREKPQINLPARVQAEFGHYLQKTSREKKMNPLEVEIFGKWFREFWEKDEKFRMKCEKLFGMNPKDKSSDTQKEQVFEFLRLEFNRLIDNELHPRTHSMR